MNFKYTVFQSVDRFCDMNDYEVHTQKKKVRIENHWCKPITITDFPLISG
jgi:hypothetical protein